MELIFIFNYQLNYVLIIFQILKTFYCEKDPENDVLVSYKWTTFYQYGM